ncbi:hypothetical protein [Streptomyces albus]|uniref:hypothetical protein n=1 Tax=Streptomyces albus TaxID=1888 RepID=UPI000ABAE02B|nr:hypothetical protein [Streptomyces albus]
MSEEERAEGPVGRSREAAPRGPVVERILISPSGMAHLPDKCNHHPDTGHAEAGWGWVMWPGEGVWGLISEQRPLRATHGRTDRIARVRCGHCVR